MGGGGEAGDRHHRWKSGQVLKRAKEHITVLLLMCYINAQLWMNQPIPQLKDSEEMADKNPKKWLKHPAVC